MSLTNTQVQELYIAYFGRPGDPGGVDFWLSGNSQKEESNAFTTSSEWASTIKGLNNDQIVTLIYENAFGRAPDAGGLKFWSDAISKGILSVGDAAWQIVTHADANDTATVLAKVTAATAFTSGIAGGIESTLLYNYPFAFSTAKAWLNGVTSASVLGTVEAAIPSLISTIENSPRVTQVQELYIAYFGRPGDPGGLDFWLNGNSQQQQSNAFTTSSEWASTIKGLNNDQIVTLIYENAFGRAPDAGGLRFWSDAISKGILSVGDAAWQIVTHADANDTATVQAKVAAANNFTFGVAGDATASSAYSDAFAFANAKTWLAGVKASSNVGTAGLAISSVISTIENGPSTSIALTKDTDTITAKHVDVTGYTTAPGVQGTYNPGDQITPTGTGNTLTVNDLQPVSLFNNTPTTWNATSLQGAVVSNVQTVTFNSNQAIIADTVNSTLGFSGLTQLYINSVSGDTNGLINGLLNGSFGQQQNVDIITAQDTTAVNVNDSLRNFVSVNNTQGAVQQGYIAPSGLTVTGGSTVAITEANGIYGSGGVITVNGGAVEVAGKTIGTSQVTINQTQAPGSNSQAVTISDFNYGNVGKPGTLTTVALDGLNSGGGQNTINSDVLSNLTVTNSTDTLVLNNQLHNQPNSNTLSLSVSNDADLRIVDSYQSYKTLSVNTDSPVLNTPSGINTNGSAINLSGFTSVTTETVNGHNVLTQDSSSLTSLNTITVSGDASFISALDQLGKLTAVDATATTSKSFVAVTLNAAQTKFTGGAGQDAVLISIDATQKIQAGSASNNEIVLNGQAANFTKDNTGKNVLGFNTLGVSTNSQGIFALDGTGALSTPINFVDVIGQTAGIVTFTGASNYSTLSFDNSSTNNVVYQTADTSGATDTLNINLGISTQQAQLYDTNLVSGTTSGFTAAADLILNDSLNNGIGNLNIYSYATAYGSNGTGSIGGYNTITLLQDVALTHLTLNGTGGFETTNFVSTRANYTGSPITFTLTDNSSSGVGDTNPGGIYFSGLTVYSDMNTLNFQGSNAGGSIQIYSLQINQSTFTVNDSYSGHAAINALIYDTTLPFQNTLQDLTLNNTSQTGILSVGNVIDTNLSHLTLSGNVEYINTGIPQNATFGQGGFWNYGTDMVTSGITVTSANNNQDVTFLTGIDPFGVNGGATNQLLTHADGTKYYAQDTISLGNGTNYVTDGGLGHVTITLGSGQNTVNAFNFNSGNVLGDQYISGTDIITFAAHTGLLSLDGTGDFETVNVGHTQSADPATGITTGYSVIKGLNTSSISNDKIVFADDTSAGNGGSPVVNSTGSLIGYLVNDITTGFSGVTDGLRLAESLALSIDPVTFADHIHQIEAFTVNHDTYLVEANGLHFITVVQLVGVEQPIAAQLTALNGTLSLAVAHA